MIARETACTNGLEIYEVTGSALDSDGKVSSQSGRADWNVGSVVSNNIPVGKVDDYYVGHLWLMFASGCYFPSVATNALVPVYDVNASTAVNPNLRRKATWELAKGSVELPLRVDYMRLHEITNASYVATGTTNIGDLQIATGFIFEERAGAQRRVRKRAEATVSSIQAVCSRAELLPAAEGKTVVIDRRLAHAPTPVPSATYTFQSGTKWIPTADIPKYAEKAQPGANSRKGIFIKVALLTLLLLPPFVIVFLAKNASKRRK